MPRNTARLQAWAAAPKYEDGVVSEVRAALDDDLDTPSALALIDEAAAAGQGVHDAAALLGVLL